MTPFWNQTSPSNLYAAACGIVDCAKGVCGDEELTWKIGLDARREIFLTAVTIEPSDIPAGRLKARMEEYARNPDRIQFCGLYGDPQGRDFPHNRLDLFSPTHGHVGTVEIVPE